MIRLESYAASLLCDRGEWTGWAQTTSLETLFVCLDASTFFSEHLLDLFIWLVHKVGTIASFTIEPSEANGQVVVIALVRRRESSNVTGECRLVCADPWELEMNTTGVVQIACWGWSARLSRVTLLVRCTQFGFTSSVVEISSVHWDLLSRWAKRDFELLTQAADVEDFWSGWTETNLIGLHRLIGRTYVFSVLKRKGFALEGDALCAGNAILVDLCPSQVVLHIGVEELASLVIVSHIRNQIVRMASSPLLGVVKIDWTLILWVDGLVKGSLCWLRAWEACVQRLSSQFVNGLLDLASLVDSIRVYLLSIVSQAHPFLTKSASIRVGCHKRATVVRPSGHWLSFLFESIANGI